MLQLAADVSDYTGPIDALHATALKAAGIKRVVVQLVNENTLVHQQQIPSLLAAGIEVEGYVYIWFSTQDETAVRARVRWACNALKAHGVTGRLWLDCEQTLNDNPPFDHIHGQTSFLIRAAVAEALANGFSTGIYTGAWWWIPGVGSTEFSTLPLWLAQYDGQPDLSFIGLSGWTRLAMKQYAGTSTITGLTNVDLDVYDDGRVPRTPQDIAADLQRLVDEVKGL